MSKGNIESMKIGAAYVGVIVGAGFSTGQEVLKFFTNYGIYSYCAILISGIMLTFFGRQISKVGYGLDVDSHEPTITYLFGEKFGKIIDYILVFSYMRYRSSWSQDQGVRFMKVLESRYG